MIRWTDDPESGGYVTSAPMPRALAARLVEIATSRGHEASWAPDAYDASVAWVYIGQCGARDVVTYETPIQGRDIELCAACAADPDRAVYRIGAIRHGLHRGSCEGRVSPDAATTERRRAEMRMRGL